MKTTACGLTLILMTLLSSCTNLSGLQGSSQYGCQAPEGVACDSISGVYANAVLQRLPSQQHVTHTVAPQPRDAERPATASLPESPPTVLPLRSNNRLLRLWIKPWEDRDGDLHDQSFVYVQIDDGRWLIEHAQRQIREAYAPIRPPLTLEPQSEPDTPQRPVRPPPPSFDPLLGSLPIEPEPSP